MIQLQMTARGHDTGNNLFQYAIARIFAEEKGWPLKCSDPLGIGSGELFKNTYGWETRSPPWKLDPKGDGTGDSWNHVGGNKVDIEKILRTDPRSIAIHGFFQYYPQYIPYKERIREWLHVDDIETDMSPSDLTIHVRLTDFCENKFDFSFEDYMHYINEINPTNVNIITDDRCNCNRCLMEDIDWQCDEGEGVKKKFLRRKPQFDHQHITIRRLESEGMTVRKESYSDEQSFRFLKSSPQILIPHSTFSWWAGFLGKGTIYCGFSRGSGYWSLDPTEGGSLADPVNLLITDEDRFITL